MQAVFYIVDETDSATHRQAVHDMGNRNAAMYGVPLLVADLTKLSAGGPLFECAG